MLRGCAEEEPEMMEKREVRKVGDGTKRARDDRQTYS